MSPKRRRLLLLQRATDNARAALRELILKNPPRIACLHEWIVETQALPGLHDRDACFVLALAKVMLTEVQVAEALDVLEAEEARQGGQANG
jgi:hypothetical protein